MKLTCISFNILGIDEADELGVENSPVALYAPSGVRAEYIAGFLDRSGADIAGLQEAGSHHGLYDWQTDFGAMVREKGTYAVASIGEESAFAETTTTFSDKSVPLSAGLMILYRKDRFELVESGAHRYASAESQERYFQWVRLRDTRDGRDILVTNTHWSINRDEQGRFSLEAGARNKSIQARELREFWEKKAGDSILFATGDYNCMQDSEYIAIAEEGVFRTAENAAGKDWGLGDHIDNIFINPQLVEVKDYRFSKEKMDLAQMRPRLLPSYYWFTKEKQNAAHRFDRMSDHDPLVLTVETK